METNPAPALPRTPPALRGVLAAHIVAMLLLSAGNSVIAMLSVLAQRRFAAGDWQTMTITAAISTLAVASIFWNELLRRVPLRRYLAVYWLVAVLPLGFVTFAQQFWHLLVLFLICAVGTAAWTPVNGQFLKRFYPDAAQGRIFAALTAAALVGGMVWSYFIGEWLAADGEAFRIYMPAAALMQGAGLVILARLARKTGADARPAVRPPARIANVWGPILHMHRTLRADRIFYRYEMAFMTYGVGWMVCNALLPLLVTHRLNLRYDEFAHTTQVVFQFCMLAVMYPMGLLLDRLGPVRLSALSFVWLVSYPISLLLAGGPLGVGVASAFYGVAMAGVNLGWMLGPVTLAPSAEKVPEYLAIHTTLVGIRGILAQGLGMLIYRLTGNFFWPFALAAIAFAWAAFQMVRLHDVMRRPRPAAVAAPKTEAAVGRPEVEAVAPLEEPAPVTPRI